MAYATPADVQARLFGRVLDTEELAVVDQRLEDAELILKSRVKDLDAKASEDEDYLSTIIMVEAEMLLRLIRNPEGYIQETDGNYSYSLSQAVASGRLEVLNSEWSLLGISGGAFTIRPYLQMPWERYP